MKTLNIKGNDEKKVRFEPDNIDILADIRANLLEVATDAGIQIIASCGGTGTCGTCKVLVKSGRVESKESNTLTGEGFQQGYRLACQSRILTDLTVYIPVGSRLERAGLTRADRLPQRVDVESSTANPPLRKFFLKLPPPTLDDNASDLTRLLRSLKQEHKLDNVAVDFDVVKKLPLVLREKNWEVTATALIVDVADCDDIRLINIEPGDTREQLYSLAFDIGTTTVSGRLLDLNKKNVVCQKTDFNHQMSYGQDVISRIAYSQKPGGLDKLQQTVVQTVNGLIGELLAESHVTAEDIGHLMVAGNTTMIHLLFGIDPKYLRLSPYVPTASFIPPVKAVELGIKAAGHVCIHSLPLVASYIGADIVSGVLASGMHRRAELTLYVDIGTNGQIVLGSSEWMVTTACSAGPAFEGGGISHGMVATNGAIEDFEIDLKTLEPVITTIGNEKPKGICGSGLIAIVASLFVNGVIGQNGKFNAGIVSPRVRRGSDGMEYVIVQAAETQTGRDIVITEIDIENLMRAKAAMYAGFQTLARSVGVSFQQLDRVIVAGNFGNYIDVNKAITIGLLPDLPRERFIFIGNGSLQGVRLASFSTDAMRDAHKVAGMMTNFELSENTDFMNNYVAALFLPHTSSGEFPSVTKIEKRKQQKSTCLPQMNGGTN